MEHFDQNGIANLLATQWAGTPLFFYEVTDSTNVQAAKEAALGAPHGTLVVADRQTAGKGRRGRAWESPAGSNLYFSLILRPEISANNASVLTLVMAHSVCRTLSTQTGLDCKIKWPNDIVIDGKKVCGILTELSFEKNGSFYLIVGVGINVLRQVFSSGLPHAASLEEVLKTKEASFTVAAQEALSRSRLLAWVLKNFEEDYALFMEQKNMNNLLDSYQHMLVNRNQKVRVLDPCKEYCGIARGITPKGELLVETETGVMETVYAGEVSVRGIYGYV